MTLGFWLISAALISLACAILLIPLWRGNRRPLKLSVVLALFIPVLTVGLYLMVGTPAALSPARVADDQPVVELDDAIAALQQRLQQQPDNLDGWLLLGRSYRTLQRYAEAEQAFRAALALDEENPVVQVELAEAMTFAAGQPRFSDPAIALLERAVASDPELQKGIWLLGIAAAQNGQDRQAIAHWQRLMTLLEPGSSVAATVSEQIGIARQRLANPGGQAPATNLPGLSLRITLSDQMVQNAAAGSVPGVTALFVILRATGTQGMPLAARRIAGPQFPLELRITDRDLLQPGSSLAELQRLAVSARLSFAGTPAASAGDLQSETITLDGLPGSAVELELNQVVALP